MTDGQAIYEIYFDPADFPGQYVVRRFITTARRDSIQAYAKELLADGEWHNYDEVLTNVAAQIPSPVADPEPLYVGDSIEVARDVVPPGSVRISRSEGDDPAIVESWL